MKEKQTIFDLLSRVRLHPLFYLVMVGAILTNHTFEVVSLFVFVFLHECGHVIAARKVGWTVHRVWLTPFGGMMETDADDSGPILPDLLVTLAGPFTHIVWIGLAYGLLYMQWSDVAAAHYVINANVTLLGYNALPIWPLDGGRGVRTILCRFFPYYTVLQWTTFVSLSGAVCMLFEAFSHVFHGQVALHNVWMALFLMYVNVVERKQAMYRLMRFVFQRSRYPPARRIQPLQVEMTKTWRDAFKQYRRQVKHEIFIVNKEGVPVMQLTEQQFIDSWGKINGI